MFVGDLAYWNSNSNPMAYARASFNEAYEPARRMLRQSVRPLVDPQTRLHASEHVFAFGSLNHPLDEKIEATYGYNPLALTRYRRYLDAARTNPDLLKGLSVSRVVNIEHGRLETVEGTLPLATFPSKIARAAGSGESAMALQTLDPLTTALVEDEPADLAADSSGEVVTISSGARSYTNSIQGRDRRPSTNLVALFSRVGGDHEGRYAVSRLPGRSCVDGSGRSRRGTRTKGLFSFAVLPCGYTHQLGHFARRFSRGLVAASPKCQPASLMGSRNLPVSGPNARGPWHGML